MGRAPSRVHGSLVEVAGIGVLLLGGSGIGKSEAALELVRRGHRLVADDVVILEADAEGAPDGYSHELVRHYMELRGIGIIHVPSLYGDESVVDRARVELVVNFEVWGTSAVERVGLDRHTQEVAGFEITAIDLPVAPGRNLATLVEVAARTHVLRERGQSGVAELDARVTRDLHSKEGKDES